MTTTEFCAQLDEILERPAGTTRSDEVLADMGNWESLAVMAFIAMVDSQLGMRIAGKSLAAAKTVTDLLALVGDKVNG